MYGQRSLLNMVPDTIDYENTRMYIEVPEISQIMSSLIEDDEGFWICFPIPLESEKWGVLTIDYSVMNRNFIKYTEDFDIELWNTFDKNGVGSRCYKKDGLFYRIDRYEDGLEIFYQDIDGSTIDIVNDIMKSIFRRPKDVLDKQLSVKRRLTPM